MSDDFSPHYQDAFFLDGSLRDIYVLRTTEHDWQQLLTFLHSGVYPIEFLLSGEQHPLPARIEEVFALVQTHGGILHIDEERLALHCYFCTSEEIEFDLDPRKMNNEHQIARLLDFMRAVGRLLNKAVILTAENASWAPLFRFDPATQKEEWFLEDIEWWRKNTVLRAEKGSKGLDS